MNLQTNSKARLSPWIFVIALFNVLFHFAFYNTLGFHRDELLYFSLGQHLSAGYASVPPFTGFIAWIIINTIGYSLLAAKLIPMLFSGLFIIVGAGIAREMNGRHYAQILVAIALAVTPINLRGFSLLQPVFFDIFFWSLVFLLSLKWINTGADKFLLLLGLVAGIGLLNKYLIALEIFGIFVAFLFSGQRVIFKNKSLYFAALIALFVFMPNIIWQLKYHLPVITHMQALHDTQLVHVNRLSFFTDQLFIGSLSLLLFIPGLLFLCFSSTMSSYRPLVVASLIVLFTLAILRGKSYYAMGLFPLWIAAGGVYWESRMKRKITKLILPVLLLFLTLPVLPMGMPVFKEAKLAEYFARVKDKFGFDVVLRWETGTIHSLPQDYADMLGWDELAQITSTAYEQVQDKKSVMIYAQNYGQAGAVMVIGKKYNLPEPACFSESFFYWFPRIPENEITTLIYINDSLGEDIKNLFTDCREIGKIQNPLARECGTGVWLCTNPKSSFNEFWTPRVTQIENPFQF